MKQSKWVTLSLLTPLWTRAHEGHGMPGSSHWHASDVLGFALAIGLVAFMIWWGGRGR